MNLYFLQYNNYYNRIFRREETVADYLEYMCGGNVLYPNPMTNVNFIPGDGVITTPDAFNWDGDHPDYVLVVDENGEIDSRWFVVESVRLCNGQYRMTLCRDLFADYWENIASAPIFLEKGFCGINDNFIFNDEQITVNQIKNREELLKDNTKSAWVVGYCAPAARDDNGNITEAATKIFYGTDESYDYYAPTLEDWDFYKYKDKTYKIYKDHTYVMKTKSSTGYGQVKPVDFYFNKSQVLNVNEGTYKSGGYIGDYLYFTASATNTYFTDRIKEEVIAKQPSNMFSTMLSNYGLTQDESIIDLYNLEGKVIKIGETRYGITLNREIITTNEAGVSYNSAYHLLWRDFAKSFTNANNANLFGNASFIDAIDSYKTTYTYEKITLTLTDLTSVSGLAFDFPATRKILADAPYCMFCMPYSNDMLIAWEKNGSFKSIDTSAANALSVAMGIATSLDAKLYDIQLLPYCPIGAIRENTVNNTLNLRVEPFTEWEEGIDYVPIEGADTFIFFADLSQGTFDIPVGGYYSYDDAITFKTNMLSQSVRLCSPNYNGVFEFNAYKNRGFSYVNVDYHYKPFQPYIHISPDFGGLYGEDFNDARGLICGGDFSLPITQDAWIAYQTQNKTYQEQFNRQIENMEVQHKYGRIQDIVNATTGTVQGAVSGGAAGMYMGGGYGAIAGAIIGGGSALAGGIADVRINQALRDEAKDYTKDMFGLQLDNIKALPNSLTRVSSLNNNNKIFPFIELYICSDEESRAIANKLKYNGFTIGRIDTLQNAIVNKPLYMGAPGYFKGQLIRLEDIGDDSHVINAIAAELYKGVYI